MLIINYKNSDDIFINIKDNKLWSEKIKKYFKINDYKYLYE